MKPNKFKKFLCAWLVSFLLAVFSIFTINIAIDPYSVWNIVNNHADMRYKFLDETIRIWKPYNMNSVNPKVLYIGDSRVLMGLPISDNSSEYNMGISASSSNELIAILESLLGNPNLNHVVVGVDLVKFATSDNKVSEEFLRRLNPANKYQLIRLKVYETLFTYLVTFDAFKSLSNMLLEKPSKYAQINGWMYPIYENNVFVDYVNPVDYSTVLYSWVSTVLDGTIENINQVDKNYELFCKALFALSERGIKVSLFYYPTAPEIQYAIYQRGLDGMVNKLKHQMALDFGFFDFTPIESWNSDPSVYYDGGHFRPSVGSKVQSEINRGTKSIYWVSASNYNVQYENADNKIKKWASRNHRRARLVNGLLNHDLNPNQFIGQMIDELNGLQGL